MKNGIGLFKVHENFFGHSYFVTALPKMRLSIILEGKYVGFKSIWNQNWKKIFDLPIVAQNISD